MQFIEGVLAKSKKSMRASEVAAAVVKAGFKTTNKSFNSTVGQMLSRRPQFKRTGTGLYTLAKKGSPSRLQMRFA